MDGLDQKNLIPPSDFEPVDFFGYGKNCMQTAELLLKDRTRMAENDYPMRVLLVHGIELLLKAFIQYFDKSKFIKGHNIKILHNIVEKIDKSYNLNILTTELNNAINKITADYYPDSVEARYKSANSSLDSSIFGILRELLIEPLEKHINS